MIHIDWETLNDYVDDSPALDATARRATTAHLAECQDCRDSLGRLRALVTAAAECASVAPPIEAWTAISDTIAQRKSVHLADRREGPAGGKQGARGWWLVLGGVVLTGVAASLVLYSMNTAPSGISSVQPAVASLPPEVLRIEREYGATADALSAAVNEPRVERNSPGVVESLARSVAVLDIAIAEARGALIEDPSNAFVRDALVRNYQQKIDLLRRVTARASSN